jgi:ABC-2 type transport system permease protein
MAEPPAVSAGGMVGRGERLRAGIAAQVRAFIRTPINVVLLVALPLVVVEGYGIAMEAFPQLPFIEAGSLAEMGRVNGAIYSVAFFAAVLGLFQVISARQADERLRICGYTRSELFATRLLTVVLGSLVITGAALSVLWWNLPPEAPVVAFGALAMAALIYGLIGMLVGAVLPRALEGSLVIVFLVDFDDFLSSGMLGLDSPVLSLFPLHFPHKLFRDAVFEGSIVLGEAAAGVAYLLAVGVIATLVYVRLTANGGDLA